MGGHKSLGVVPARKSLTQRVFLHPGGYKGTTGTSFPIVAMKNRTAIVNFTGGNPVALVFPGILVPLYLFITYIYLNHIVKAGIR